MGEFAASFGKMFEKISDFFDVFDLSFFVSGVLTLLAVAFVIHRIGDQIPSLPDSIVGVVVLILVAYLLGLISFAAGRWVRLSLLPLLSRRSASNQFDERLNTIIHAHGVERTELGCRYLERKNQRGIWRLYIRMWSEIRHAPEATPSMSLLRRYWVMAATYDGVAISLLIWSGVLLWSSFGAPIDRRLPIVFGLTASGGCLIFAISALREAARYLRYQMEEVVATFATVVSGTPTPWQRQQLRR